MRAFLCLSVVFLVAGVVLAAPLTLVPAVRVELTNCSSGGSAASTINAGSYLFRVKDEDTFVCFEATCATGGEAFVVGTVLHLRSQGGSVSCRSSGSTGDIIFTRAE